MKYPAMVCVAIVLLAAARPAAAEEPAEELVDANDFEYIASIIQELGYRAALGESSSGKPQITSSVGGSEFFILPYGCQKEPAKNCSVLLFRVGYDLAEGSSLESMNEWNSSSLIGTSYLDSENDPWVDFAVNLKGGVSRANFEDSFEWWEVTVAQFEDHIYR